MKNASYSHKLTQKPVATAYLIQLKPPSHQTPVILDYITQLYHFYSPSSDAGQWFSPL